MPKLYIFVGAPGAGKTSVAHAIAARTGAVHLWADHERHAMFNQVTHSKQESKALYNYLNEQTNDLLTAGKSVIFDTNFNYQADRDHLRRIAKKHGAEMTIIWLTTPLDMARRRAVHPDQRDRNKYAEVMTDAEFDHLTNHLEPPTDHEHFITVDGTSLDTEQLFRQLGI